MKKYLLLLVLLLILTSTGCSSQSSENKKPIRIGVLPIEDTLPLYVAESEDFFKQSGVEVELISFNSARDRDMALQAGEIDGEVADVLAAALLEKSDVGVSIITLTLGVSPKEGRFALLSSPNSKILTPEQVKGASVGISENTIIEYVLDQLLTIAGVDSSGINKEAIPRIPERLELLLNDQIDTAVLPDPLASLAEAEGAHVILDDTKTQENISQVVLMFSENSVNNNSDNIAKILEAYNKAVQEFNDNPEQYRDLFIEKARVPKPIQDIYQPPKFSPAQVPKEADINRLFSWMKEKDLIDDSVRYSDLIDSRFLKD